MAVQYHLCNIFCCLIKRRIFSMSCNMRSKLMTSLNSMFPNRSRLKMTALFILSTITYKLESRHTETFMDTKSNNSEQLKCNMAAKSKAGQSKL